MAGCRRARVMLADMSPPAASNRLVGREAEVARLVGALDLLGRGTAVVVDVTGEAGIGKSRLLAEARRLAAGRGLTVASASASGAGAGEPFALAGALLDRLGIDGAAPSGHRALAALLAQAARTRPLVITVDDVHDGDAESVEWLTYLAHGRLRGPIALLLARRPSAGLRRLGDAMPIALAAAERGGERAPRGRRGRAGGAAADPRGVRRQPVLPHRARARRRPRRGAGRACSPRSARSSGGSTTTPWRSPRRRRSPATRSRRASSPRSPSAPRSSCSPRSTGWRPRGWSRRPITRASRSGTRSCGAPSPSTRRRRGARRRIDARRRRSPRPAHHSPRARSTCSAPRGPATTGRSTFWSPPRRRSGRPRRRAPPATWRARSPCSRAGRRRSCGARSRSSSPAR